MQTDFAKLKELFLVALKLPVAERAAYLETACAGDTALRREIEGMLQNHENAGELLPRSPAEILQESGTTEADATASLHAEPRGSSTRIEPSHVDANDLSFLAPSRKPGSLGRLDHYEILEVVGKGGFGMVLRAFDEKLHRIVAIKVLSLELSANGTARQRFIREARTAAAVVHEHVVTIHAVVEEHRPPYLVMQMIDGVTLQQKLDKSGTLHVRQVLRIGMQMAEGLAAAHKQGLVHRDIKPANILLENGIERVKITDFGLARAVDDASVTQSGTVAGTPMYMSPEQAEGLPIDHRSDLFSLGTVLYAMCTGHPPFRASGTHAVLKRVIDASPRPIREINSEIPDWLCAIIGKLHAKKPEDRFQTAKEVAELLGQRLADVQVGRVIAGEPKDASGRVEAPMTGTVPAAEPQLDHPPSFSAVLKSVLRGWSAGAAAGVICLLIVIPSVVARNSIVPGRTGLNVLPFAAVSLLIPMAFGALSGLINGLAKWFFPSHRPVAAPVARFAFGRKMALIVVLSLLTIALCALLVITSLPGEQEITVSADDPGVRVTMTGQNRPALTDVGPGLYVLSLPTGRYYLGVRCGVGRKLESVQMIEHAGAAGYATLHGQAFQEQQEKLPANEKHFELEVKPGQRLVLHVKTSALSVADDGSGKQPDAEKDGWVPLFNGQDLKGWVPRMDPDDPISLRAWEVLDKVLIARGNPNGYLRTEKPYQHFVLEMECQASLADHQLGAWAGDLLFQIPVPDPGIGKLSGFRLQIDPGRSGSFVAVGAMAPPPPKYLVFHPDWKAFKPDWNQLRFKSTADRFEIILNGKSILKVPDYRPQPGYFAIMSVGTGMRYRNIRIKELTAPPTESGWGPLFNGKDLTGWGADEFADMTLIGRVKATGAWEVQKDERLVYKGPGVGPLRTTKTFTDFCLRFEYQYLQQFPNSTLPSLTVELRGQPTPWTERVHPLVQFTPAGKNAAPVPGPVEALPGGTVIVSLDPNKEAQQFQDKEFKPHGWNSVEIRCIGDSIEVISDGFSVSKTQAGKARTGSIVLQPNHAGMAFRKIEIKELPRKLDGDALLLQGTWEAHSVSRIGKLPTKDEMEQIRVAFNGDRMRWTMPGGIIREGTFKLDSNRQPNEIDLIPDGAKEGVGVVKGIYWLRTNPVYLTLCLGQPAPGDIQVSRPARFDVVAETDHISLVLHKVDDNPESGWGPLFNGKDLTGWVPVYDKQKSAPWDISEPNLILKSAPQESGYLRTQKQYREFHLRFEYRPTPFAPQNVDSRVNSAIMWGVQGPDDPTKRPVNLGMELVQNKGAVWYPKAIGRGMPWKTLKVGSTQQDGWNRAEVVSKAGLLEFIINGEKTALDAYQPVEGFIGLYSGVQGLHLRNIEIKELSPSK
jgi:uncharacterized protein (TIGR03067 family)